MADFGWSMPMGAEEKKDRLDRREADYYIELDDVIAEELEAIKKGLAEGNAEIITAVTDQLTDKIEEFVLFVFKSKEQNLLKLVGIKFALILEQAIGDAAEVAAIKKMEGRK